MVQFSISQRPRLQSMALVDGLRVRAAAGWVTQEKKDGVFAFKEFSDCILAGEQMRDGTFWAFDLVQASGEDCTAQPYRVRLSSLTALASTFPPNFKIIPSGSGGEYLEHIIAQGGEGVVFKNLDCKWGQGQHKCKREETHDCVVAARNDDLRSLSIIQHKDGATLDCGNVASLSEFEWNTIRIGDVVEIKCLARHKSGKFREPRIFRLRPDKLASECIA